MVRRLCRCLLVTLVAALVVDNVSSVRAAGPTNPVASSESLGLPILRRFLTIYDPDPTDFRVMRHVDARSERFGQSAWMDVWTEADRHGFRYRIAAEGGSEYIRSKVFRATLEAERKMWADGSPARAALTLANYVFENQGAQPDGLISLTIQPRRKDDLLVAGTIYLDPDDGDLVRLEGRLVKSPSFWTRKVEIVRRYRRFAGVRMPVALESVAHILIAGKSTFRVTYDYESVNGQRFGSPQPRAQQADGDTR